MLLSVPVVSAAVAGETAGAHSGVTTSRVPSSNRIRKTSDARESVERSLRIFIFPVLDLRGRLFRRLSLRFLRRYIW